MNRKHSLIALGAITLLGSIVGYVGTNYFMVEVLNKGGNMFATALASLPMLCLGSILIAGFLYVVRLFKRPKTFKKLSKHYLIIGLVLSGVGFLSALLAGILVYGTFFGPNPFYGYLVIMLVLFAVAIWACIFLLNKIKNKEDEEEYKVRAPHVFSTIGWFLFIGLVFNRTGSFLFAPFYIQWRTLYLTFPFYCYLLCPLFVGVVKVLTDFRILERGSRLILPMVAGGLQATLFIAVAAIGVNDTLMVSAISPAMPLERMAGLPVEIIIHFLSMTAVSIILIVQAVRNKNANI